MRTEGTDVYCLRCVVIIALRQDVLVFVGAGEEGLGIGTERDDLAVAGARKVHGGKNHLTGDTASFKALKNAGVINNYPLWSGALVRHCADLYRFRASTFFRGFQPCLENAVLPGLVVLNSYHGCLVFAFIHVRISFASRTSL